MYTGISMLQVAMILMASVGLMNHVLVIPAVLDTAGRDAWLSALACLPVLLVWTVCLIVIVKRSGGRPLLEWVRERTGRAVSGLLRLVLILYLLLAVFITVKDTVVWAATSYLPETPVLSLALLLLLLCFVAARSGILCIAVMTGILLPVIVVLGWFVAFGNVPNKDYTLLFPLMEEGGAPFARGMILSLGAQAEVVLFVFLQHHIRTSVRWWHLALLVVILVGLTVGPVTGSIAEFGPVESAKQRYPAFEQWKLVNFRDNVERLDFLSIYQWSAGAFIRVSTYYVLLIELLPVKRQRTEDLLLLGLTGMLLALCAVHWPDVLFYEWLKTWYLPGSLIGWGLLTLLLLGIVLFTKRKGGRTRDHARLD
ncbi:endospore germination permease [Paenibacillus caseinilyticus]|uniref:Spore germination protein n=1 Tax=Paenibacillus mucilaginosus K02 TaxID=997761 RepID=I0BRT3_9BACL|nr:endospore germination permease [Paenibacillus mucilaginosus]AFH65080.1 spore germination protein [Paenibacillus mucilaginosus K02]